MIFSISIFVFFFLAIQNKNKHTQVVDATLKERIANENQSEIIKKNLDFIKSSQEKINTYFVNVKNVDTFIGNLEKIGENNNVNLEVKGVDTSKTDGKYITINISIDGSFSNLVKTIEIIENMPYKINFKSIYLNKEILSTQNSSDPTKNVISAPLYKWSIVASFDVLSSN
jgi:hypothetical protein